MSITRDEGVSGDLFSSSLSLSSTNGSINVNVANDDVLAASNIHGLNNGNGGTIRLDAKENINISASVAVSDTYNNLTAITNSGSNSTAILTAGGYISLNSKGNGSSIAIANLMSSNLQLTSQGKNDSGYGMEITSEASGVNSYAIENEGSIYLQALNGGIHLAAEGGTDTTRALYSYNGSVQFIADSDIFLEASGNSKFDTSGVFAFYNGKNEEGKAAFSLIGKSITIEAQNNSGVSYGVYAQESDVDINADYFSKVNSSTYGLFSHSVDKVNSFNLNLTSSSNYVEAGATALYSYGVNSNINLEATGVNSVIEQNTGENITGKNIVVSQSTGLWTQNSGKITLKANKENYIKAPTYGIYVESGEVLLKAENGSNRVEIPNSTAIKTIGANSVVTIDTTSQDASSIKGTNYLVADTAYWAQGGELKLKAVEGNYLDVINNGLFVDQAGIALLEVSNGVNRIESGTLTETNGITSGNGQAIYVTANGLATLNSLNGNNEILGYIRTYKGDSSKIALTASNNLISSTNTYTVSATNGSISLHANGTGTGNSGNNFIYSKYANGYGEGLAIRALSQGSVYITAQETNSIFGAISSKNEGSSVSVDGKTNFVKSFAVISNAGNLNNATDDKFKDNRVISALYAEGKGAQISLTGEQNYLYSRALRQCTHRPRTCRLGLRWRRYQD